MMVRFAIRILLWLLPMPLAAQSGLNQKEFKKYWRIESEAPDYRVAFRGDTCELTAPKGLTLWRKQPFTANTIVEYDVLVTDDRLSDMNCFWLASDPQHKDIWQRADWRSGIFTRCYTLQMYYLGYGGNHNTTTRFRRYTGDERGVEDTAYRPTILKEYSDADHLLRSGHWYHVKIESTNGRTRFYIDQELLVDYLDPQPLQQGWFGFRTTLSRCFITNFQSRPADDSPLSAGIPLHWVGTPREGQPVTFGIPFRRGELKDASLLALSDGSPSSAWATAYWPDGSVKWAGMSAVAGKQSLRVVQEKKKKTATPGVTITETDSRLMVNTGRLKTYIPKTGKLLIDSMILDGKRVGGAASLVASTAKDDYQSEILRAQVEHQSKVHAVVKIEGRHANARHHWLPFVVRLYFWQGSEQVKLLHTFTYDGEQSRDIITALGIRFGIPMRTETYNRHIAFAMSPERVWTEPVQPLDGRRELRLRQSPPEEGRGIPQKQNIQMDQMRGQRIPPREAFDTNGQSLIDNWAQWDGFRLSQLTDNAFSIRKRATDKSPWIGTLTGNRAPGYAFVGDVEGGMGIGMKDFWQSYPSTIEVADARSSEAHLTMYLWSPEAEPMNLCHYDTIAHGLLESYEDVQAGMSTPYGIARTSELWLLPQTGYPGRDAIMAQTAMITEDAHLLPTPEYLHSRQAFGCWSLPSQRKEIEDRLEEYIRIYQRETERCKWYGFWNYGDFMHAYDPERDEWRYDVGGYAWDNTELASPVWLWAMFLRTGRQDIWRMAEAMTRHNSEVDTYHIGPFAPLGSRHNVSHWGCGAKEARISQSAFLRYYYYLTADERTGDLMHQQTDADTLLWHLDPMRLAEPREKFPCSAPARLRIGPDWLSYAGNWMTEWERTGNAFYYNKIRTGMQSIAGLKDGIFTGNLAKGYDPATGRISYDGPDSLRSTSHLLSIMGGFEVMNELLPLMADETFNKCWLDHARRYREMAMKVSKNKFPVRRLDAYAAWHDRDPQRMKQVWQSLLAPSKGISTNEAALWSLDAIYMLEVTP
ncbi:MAG: hypothetical protein IJ614_01040 [Prevotella sp.]|nr:hypothetical protein [Prevotella sp.]